MPRAAFYKRHYRFIPYSVWNWWRIEHLTTNSRVVQPSKGHVKGTTMKLKSQMPECILRLGQLVTWLMRCTASLFCVIYSFLYPQYINPHYPWNCKGNFKEKILEIHLRVGDCTPTILYTFLLVFLYSFLSNSILFERLFGGCKCS